MRPFAEVWQEIKNKLSVGTEVRYWRKMAQPTQKVFLIKRVNHDEVAVGGSEIAGIRSVSRKDFETLYEHWSDYKNGDVKRGVLGSTSRNSSYIFSIFKWLEDKIGDE